MRKIYCIFLFILSLVSYTNLQAQQMRGKVLDTMGKPIVGAIITSPANPHVIATSDTDGAFEILLPVGSKLKVATPIYEKIVVAESLFNTIRVGEENTIIETWNGIRQTQLENSAAISTISSKDIMKSSEINSTNTLYGRGLGLTALQSAGQAYDSNTEFKIRGVGTLHANKPLVLVDGFERPLDLLVKEEIESIDILKDAASLAMLGLRGANGAIVVKTKQGKIGKTSIDFSYDRAFLQLKRIPEFANAYTYAMAQNEALKNDGITPRYNDNMLKAYQSGAFPDYFPNVNWMEQVLKNNASSNNYNLTIQGGTNKVRYFTVLNYADHDGFMKPENTEPSYSSQFKYSRLNIRTNLEIKLSSSTEMTVRLLGSLSEINRPGSTLDNIMPALYNTPALAFPVQTNLEEWGGSNLWKTNPVAMVAAKGYGKNSSRSLLADWTLKQDLSKFVKGLSADLSIRFDNSASYWESIAKNYRYYTNSAELNTAGDALVNPVSTLVGSNSVPVFASSLGSQWRHFSFFSKINYNKSWKNVSLNSNLMFRHNQYIGNGQFSTDNFESLIAFTHLGFYQKYFLDISLTGSGSNSLQPNNNIGLFPAVSGAWVVTNEDFLKDAKAIDFLKIRASFGIVGDDYTSGNELFKQTYGNGGAYFFTDNYTSTAGMTELRMATTGLTYEKSQKTNIGIESRFWNALDVNVELFHDRRTDILISTAGSVSKVLGATASMSNDGEVVNKGIELGLNYNNSIQDFKYNIGGQFTYTKSKIINMNEAFQPFDYLKQTGQAVNQIFGYEALGFFKDQADITASPVQLFSTVSPGDIKFKDQNDDNKINEQDKIALGYNNVCPEIVYAMNVNLEYKGIGIDANFQGVANYSAILNTASLFWPLRNNTTISNYYFENRWTPENQDVLFPRLSTTQNQNNYSTNSVWIKDRSFLKLRTCELYYRFPEKSLLKYKITKAKIYARGMDLYSFGNIKVVDPESIGISLPLSASINIGINLGF